MTFYTFTGLAALGAIVFSIFVPETKMKTSSIRQTPNLQTAFE
jgi:hypothetical protein